MAGFRSKYKLVIFDFDGTLADSFPWFLRTMNLAAERFRFNRVEDGDIEPFRLLSSRQIIARLGLPSWKMPFVARFMRTRMAEHVSAIKLFADVDAVLAALASSGIAVAIVTSNSYSNVLSILGTSNTPHVKYFECSVSAFGKKRRLKKLLRACRINRMEAVFIGDEVRDADAARAEGIDYIGVAWGYADSSALKPFSCKPILARLDDLLRCIQT